MTEHLSQCWILLIYLLLFFPCLPGHSMINIVWQQFEFTHFLWLFNKMSLIVWKLRIKKFLPEATASHRHSIATARNVCATFSLWWDMRHYRERLRSGAARPDFTKQSEPREPSAIRLIHLLTGSRVVQGRHCVYRESDKKKFASIYKNEQIS